MVSALRKFRRLFVPAIPPEDAEIVCVDLETSHLDARAAELLTIGAVPVRDRRVVTSERFEAILSSDASTDPEAVKYHRLRPNDLADGEPGRDVLARFLEWLAGRPLLGYCIAFDRAILDRALAKHRLPELGVDTYDLRDLYRRRYAHQRPHEHVSGTFDAILAELGVPVPARHTAIGDALAVAYAYLALRYGKGPAEKKKS
jgi:DNA polymerase-3 subunit epsilon